MDYVGRLAKSVRVSKAPLYMWMVVIEQKWLFDSVNFFFWCKRLHVYVHVYSCTCTLWVVIVKPMQKEMECDALFYIVLSV